MHINIDVRRKGIEQPALSFLTVFASVLTMVFAFGPSTAIAQRGLPRVISMQSGVRFEGDLIPVEGFASKLAPTTASIWAIDEGHRRVFVSAKRIVNNVASTRVESTIPIWQNAYDGNPSYAGSVLYSPFDKNGHRVLTADGSSGSAVRYIQGITSISPRYVVVKTLKGGDAPKRVLTMSVAMNQVPTGIIRNLLRKQIKNGDNSLEYRELISFYLQAQQFGEAIETLRFMRQKFPEEQDDLDDIQIKIQQDEARQILTEIELRTRNGQTELAQGMAGLMKLDGVAPQVVAQLQATLDGITSAKQRVVDAREKVNSLVESFKTEMAGKLDAFQDAMLNQFLLELNTELRPSTVSRLDSYMVQADDPGQMNQQKVALAISGWLLGSNNATANFGEAQSMFAVRDLIKKYLLSGDANQRNAIFAELDNFEAREPRFVAQMLAQMKPPEHELATAGYDIEKAPIEFSVAVPGTLARPQALEFRCLVHLPDEYDPYEKYPLLITLPGEGTLESNLQAFTGQNARLGRASRNGMIVMAVEYRVPGATSYTALQHATVLSAMRASFRKFSVDTDRVFLHGNKYAANLVYDIGLAHPEHFAGLIPVSGVVERYAKVHHADTGIPLAIYAVMGEQDINTNLANKEVFNRWLRYDRHVDFVAVSYKGRFYDYFPDDIPNMFDWMQFQRRRLPDRLGFEFSVKSLRPWDNYYWFLQLNDFPLERAAWPQNWSDKLESPPLVLAGELKAQDDTPNMFTVKPASSGGSMTLWLSDEFVDFEKEIRIKGRGSEFRGSVVPSTKIILEDARRRGDRLHPYWARLDHIGGTWQIAE